MFIRDAALNNLRVATSAALNIHIGLLSLARQNELNLRRSRHPKNFSRRPKPTTPSKTPQTPEGEEEGERLMDAARIEEIFDEKTRARNHRRNLKVVDNFLWVKNFCSKGS